MTNIENFYSIARRTGYSFMPATFNMCKNLSLRFEEYRKENEVEIKPVWVDVPDLRAKVTPSGEFLKYYSHSFKEGTVIDDYGIAHEPGSAAAFHMTKMYHPMEKFDSVDQIREYPFPDYTNVDATLQLEAVKKAHNEDLIAVGNMQVTIWERSWYLRGMENMMTDMMLDDPIAEVLLDKITDISMLRARSFAESGADVLFVGDDVGMQYTIMMSEQLYCDWLKYRLKKVIDAAKSVNPNIIVFYHSCGFITPMIPHLIESGVDVLNPIQPECMNFEEIHSLYGDKLSFHGTIGTQTTMPFGSADDVRREVFKNLEIAGDKGGLFVSPTHLLEPEVPVENVIAYINACRDFK